MKLKLSAVICASAALFVAAPASAHFILLAPDAWVEVNVLGDPQKAAPCGTSSTSDDEYIRFSLYFTGKPTP